jgi:hypothetical protein
VLARPLVVSLSVASDGISEFQKRLNMFDWAVGCDDGIANRWKFVSFRGVDKGEWRGVVDLIAIRKNSKQPPGYILKRCDLFDIILIRSRAAVVFLSLRHFLSFTVALFPWLCQSCGQQPSGTELKSS